MVRDGSAKALFLGSNPSVTFTTAFYGGCFFMRKYFISSLEPFRKIFLFDFSFAILVVESFTTGESYE